MNDFYKFIRTFFGLIADTGSLVWEHVVDYKDFLWWLTKRFALFAAIPIPVLIICLIFGWHVNWLYSVYFIFVGAEAVILMVLAFPIIAAAQVIFDKFPQFAVSIRKSVQIIAAVAFWALMLAVYFYVVPVWENPKMVPLVLMAAAALALGAYTGWVNLPRSLVKTITTVFLVSIFVIATLAFIFPNRTRQFVGLMQKIDEADSKPKQIMVESPDQIQFVNVNTGEQQIWYYRSPTGEYELYDHDGFHSSGVQLKPAKTVEERNQIITWFLDQAQRAKEDKKNADDLQNRIAQDKKKKADELAQQQAQDQARQERETFKNTYLRDRSFLNRPETKEAAIVMVEDKMINQPLGESVAAIFDANGLRTTTTLFTDKFVTDGLFEKFFDEGGSSEIAKLELASNADILILGKRTASFTTNPDLQNIITAKVTLAAKTISVKSAQTVDTFSFSETGIGFSNDAAVAAAMEKILKQWKGTQHAENRQ
jgi:hypothetical protein